MDSAPTSPRWGPWRAAECLGSGRQALALVARWCRSRGITTAVLPRYHCETMALPFWLEVMTVRTTAVDARLQSSPGELARLLAGMSSPVLVLVCRVGGLEAPPGLAQILGSAREAGHVVVEDATHSLLDDLLVPRPELPADIRVASLRKLLPLPEGAWIVTGPRVRLESPSARRDADERVTDTGLALLDRQQRWAARSALPAPGAGRAPASAGPLVAAMQAADEALDAALEPAPASPSTLGMLCGLDAAGRAADWRRANADFCALLPADVEVLNPRRACFPVIRHRLASRLDEALGTKGAFAPQYWPRPGWLAEELGWPQDLVSIDIGPGQAPGRAAALAHIVRQVLGVTEPHRRCAQHGRTPATIRPPAG